MLPVVGKQSLKTEHHHRQLGPSTAFIPMQEIRQRALAIQAFCKHWVTWVYELVQVPKLFQVPLPGFNLGYMMSLQQPGLLKVNLYTKSS